MRSESDQIITDTHIIYIGVGSNLQAGKAVAAIEKSVCAAASLGTFRASSIYSTEGVGVKSAGMMYHNAVIELITSLDEQAVTAALKEYEMQNGRQPGSPEIPIDLDLVVFDGIVLRPTDFNRVYFQIGYKELTNSQ